MTEKLGKDAVRKHRIAKVGRTFIILMIVLTFLSKTIINMTLPKVNIIEATSGELNNRIYGSGKVVARNRFEYYTKLQLPVKDIKVKVGDKVEQGELLIILDDQEILEQIAEYKYLLKVSENNLKKLLLDREVIEEEDFSFLKSEIEDLEPENSSASSREELIEELEKKERSKERSIKKIDLEIDNQKLDIERLKRQIEKLNSKSNKCQIKAETSGIMGDIEFSLNEITNTSRPLYIIDEIHKGYQVVANLPNKYKNIIEIGQKVIVQSRDGDIKNVEGIISFFGEKKGNSEIELIIEIDSEDYSIGSEVDITIIVEGGNFDTIIPNASIHKESEGRYYVFVLEQRNGPLGEEYYAVRKDIDIGASNNHMSGIESGLNRGDLIIASSNKILRDGMRVVVDD